MRIYFEVDWNQSEKRPESASHPCDKADRAWPACGPHLLPHEFFVRRHPRRLASPWVGKLLLHCMLDSDWRNQAYPALTQTLPSTPHRL